MSRRNIRIYAREITKTRNQFRGVAKESIELFKIRSSRDAPIGISNICAKRACVYRTPCPPSLFILFFLLPY